MKKEDLIHIIRQLVAEEMREKLPAAIAEVFQKLMTQSSDTPDTAQMHPSINDPDADVEDDGMKQSLKELFGGSPSTTKIQQKPVSKPKTFTKNPILNEVLNQTSPFSSQERMGASMGTAAMIAAAQAGNPMSLRTEMPDMGDVRDSRPNISPITTKLSQGELLSDTHAPLSSLPEGVSVMDVKQHVPPVVSKALTRNYSQMMKLIDKKQGKA